jgi:PAS domain S-box-containing protein
MSNNFLTSGIKAASPEEVRRVKVLNVFELVFAIGAPLLGLFYFRIGASFLFQTCMVAGALAIVAIFLLRVTKSPGFVGNFAVLILWAFLVIIRWHTGSISASGLILLSWVWNGALILLAIYVTGYMWGTIWACLVFVESGFAVFLFRQGHEFTNLIPAGVSPLYSLGSYLTGLLAILLLAFLFEKERADAQRREGEKSKVLRFSKRYTEDILERSPVPTFVLDNSHRVVQWNRACQELTGIGPQEILGKRVWEGFFLDKEGSLADKLLDTPEILPQQFNDSIVSRSESGSFAVETFLPNLKDGLRAIINTAPILGEDGEVKGAIQTIQDIGKGDGNPEKGSFVFDGSIEDAAYPAFKMDSLGKISGWNKGCEQSYNYPASEMLGKSPLVLVSKDCRHEFKDAIVRVFKGESVLGKEWTYTTSDGKSCHVLAQIYPVRGISGQVSECIIVNSDMMELKLKMKKLERYATESKDKLTKLSREYDLLKSNIASFIRRKT